MNILGIDTSSGLCSVGIAGDNLNTVLCKEETGYKFNERLFNIISETFKKAKIKKDEIDGIAVCIGPGSFTGIRVGISAAKGLAHTLNIPIAGITVFDAWAYEDGPHEYPACSLFHVKNDLIAYCVINNGDEDSGKRSLHESTFDELAMIAGKFKTIFSNITGEPETILKNKLPRTVSVVGRATTGAVIAEIGLNRLRKGLGDDIVDLSPIYVHSIKFRKKNERPGN